MSEFVDLRKYRRINVVGTSGSGKTTFSRKLAANLSIPHIEMDAVFWGPKWSCPSDEEFFPKVAAAVQADSWILDGNYTRTIPIKWAKVECVVWLDLPFWQTVSRVTRRAIGRALSQEEIWEGTGNRETFRGCFFSKDSVVLWAIQMHSRNRQKYPAMMKDPNHKHIHFVRIRSSKDADSLINASSQ